MGNDGKVLPKYFQISIVIFLYYLFCVFPFSELFMLLIEIQF